MMRHVRFLAPAMLVLALSLIGGCRGERAEKGDTVSVTYTLTLDDGTEYYATGNDPVQYTLGEGQLLPDLEVALRQMSVGEARSLTIPPDRAYGPHQAELVTVVNRDALPEGSMPMVGMQIQGESENGSPLVLTITKVDNDEVTLDANHPLAGKNLTFELTLAAINAGQPASPQAAPSSFRWLMVTLTLIAVSAAAIYLRGRLRMGLAAK